MFIGGLAFPDSPDAVEAAKIGTLAGSLLSAVVGWAVLRFTGPISFSEEDRDEALEIFGDDQADRLPPPTLAEGLAAGEPGMRSE